MLSTSPTPKPCEATSIRNRKNFITTDANKKSRKKTRITEPPAGGGGGAGRDMGTTVSGGRDSGDDGGWSNGSGMTAPVRYDSLRSLTTGAARLGV